MSRLDNIVYVMNLMKEYQIAEEDAFKLAQSILDDFEETEKNIHIGDYAIKRFIEQLGQWKYNDGLSYLTIAIRNAYKILGEFDEDEELYDDIKNMCDLLDDAKHIFEKNKL